VSDQVSHPYRTTGKDSVLNIFMFLITVIDFVILRSQTPTESNVSEFLLIRNHISVATWIRYIRYISVYEYIAFVKFNIHRSVHP